MAATSSGRAISGNQRDQTSEQVAETTFDVETQTVVQGTNAEGNQTSDRQAGDNVRSPGGQSDSASNRSLPPAAAAAAFYRRAVMKARLARELKELLRTSLLIFMFVLACMPGLILQSNRSYISSHPESFKSSIMLLFGALTLPMLGCVILPLILYARDPELRAWAIRSARRLLP